MTETKKSASNVLALEDIHGETEAELKGRAALRPSINAMLVIDAFGKNVMGKDADMATMMGAIQDSTREVKDGDLSTLEAMLLGQATALQTVFTSLALRASSQERLPNYQMFMGLALKAQAQSRATISALVELKHPKQATFVKQANIAHGPQQVNNGAAPAGSLTHTEQEKSEPNKLLEAEHGQPGGRMDVRAAQAAKRSHQSVETVESVQRAKKPKR